MESSNEIAITEKILALADNVDGENGEQIKEQLAAYINELITKDFSALVQLLYRVDIDEQKLKKLLQQEPGMDAALIITDLIIARQLQKKERREKFKRRDGSKGDELW
ncbi:MAG: hypothetical protein ABIN25_11590 [Ginsengibacter sp.]